MRKLLLLFLALLTIGSSGAWAQEVIADGGIYQICIGTNSKVGTADNATRYVSATGKQAANFGDAAFYKLTAVDGYYYIQENASSKYLGCNQTQVDSDLSSGTYSRNANTIILEDLPETDEAKQYYQWTITLAANSTNVYLIKPRKYTTLSLAVYSIQNNENYFCLFNSDSYAFARVSFFQKKVTALTDFSNNKCYNIYNNRAAWAVGSGADVVNSTSSGNGLNLAIAGTDSKQRFAFIKYIDKYYLYSVGEGKFAYRNGTKLSLAASYSGTVEQSPVTFQTSTNATYAASAPVVITVNGMPFGVSTGFNPTVLGYDDLADSGNASAIYEADSFDPTSALSQIETSFPFTPSTVGSPIYYAMTISGNANSWLEKNSNGTDVNCNQARPLPSGDASDWAWLLIGDVTNGYKLYNVGAGKYLGGQTRKEAKLTLVNEGSAQTFFPVYNSEGTCKFYDKTNDLWIDRSGTTPWAHGSGQQFTFQRLYKVKFALSNAAAGLNVGTEAVNDFDTEYIITTSASLSCVNDGYSVTAYDGYATLAEALENDADGTINLSIQQVVDVTYKMMFNGSEITSARTIVSEIVGSTASTPSAWTAPDYCSFTCPATEITATPSPIEVTLNWTGPFDFSADYASAVWYLMNVGGRPVYYSSGVANTPSVSTFQEAYEIGDNALWAFIGNPIDGIQIINKGANDKYLYAYDRPNMSNLTSEFDIYKKYQISEVSNGFTLVNTGFYLVLNDDKLYMQQTNASNQDALITVRSYYCQQALDNWAAYVGESTDQIFGVRSESVSFMETMILGMPKMTETEYNSYFATIPNSNIAGYITYNMPATGYYRIKNYVETDQYISAVSTGLERSSDNTSVSTVVKITNNNPNYTLQMQGLYVQTPTKDVQVTLDDSSVSFKATVREGEPGWVSLNAGGGADMYLNLRDGSSNGSTEVVGYKAATSNRRSFWKIEEATSVTIPLNTVGGKSYATFCAPFDVTIGAGATAYQVDLDTENNRAVYTAIADNEVPANAGVLLISDDAESSVTATIRTSGDAFSALSGNDLVGYCIAPTFSYPDETTDWNLVLGVANGTIGFYKMGTGTPSPNKAYLPYPHVAGSSVKGFALVAADELEDGISEVNSEKSTSIYNLAGQRLDNSQLKRGIYVVNGEKVVIK